MTDFNFDNMDDFETAAVRVTESEYARKTYPCNACGGTGFYQGVRLHEEREHCFACRGVGHFVTSPEDRKNAKKQRQERKEREATRRAVAFGESLMAHGKEFALWFETSAMAGDEFLSSLYNAGEKYGALTEKQEAAVLKAFQRHVDAQFKADLFKSENEAVCAWLYANNGNFATSLRESLEKWGSLSEKQVAAVQRIIDADAAKVTIDLTKIFELFNSALAAGAKRPVIRLEGLKLSLAGKNSSNAGCIYVKSEWNDYLGKITPEGKFFGLRTAPADTEEKLVELAKDPKAAMVNFGRITGSCACCGRELTNAASIELGIGPICAEKFGVL